MATALFCDDSFQHAPHMHQLLSNFLRSENLRKIFPGGHNRDGDIWIVFIEKLELMFFPPMLPPPAKDDSTNYVSASDTHLLPKPSLS